MLKGTQKEVLPAGDVETGPPTTAAAPAARTVGWIDGRTRWLQKNRSVPFFTAR